jgi:hypothetical protein
MFNKFFNKKSKELDPNELLPLCLRCFNVGIIATEEQNYCHMCGSEGTCVEMKRKDIAYFHENLDTRLEMCVEYGKKLAKEE